MKYLNENILECEFEYQKCFSNFYEAEDIFRFTDDKLPDMYCHNYTYIKKELSSLNFKDIIENEIEFRLSQNNSFCNLYLTSLVNSSLLPNLKYSPDVSLTGYYQFDISKFQDINSRNDCIVKILSSEKMVDDLLYCDLQHDEDTLGRDFCEQRCYRRKDVYLSDENINSYLCYHNEQVIGSCDLFIHNKIAKIEDFAIIPYYQRMGYGTSILNHLIDIAINKDCHTIYLVTDEEDTAKEMYKKIGFYKVHQKNDLFFKF